jgi:hypothetical protein
MIGMLVGDQNGSERFGIVAEGMEPFEGLFAGEPRVDQETGPLRANQRGIASARRRENRNFDDKGFSRRLTITIALLGNKFGRR